MPLLEIPLSTEGRGANARCFGYSRRRRLLIRSYVLRSKGVG